MKVVAETEGPVLAAIIKQVQLCRPYLPLTAALPFAPYTHGQVPKISDEAVCKEA